MLTPCSLSRVRTQNDLARSTSEGGGIHAYTRGLALPVVEYDAARCHVMRGAPCLTIVTALTMRYAVASVLGDPQAKKDSQAEKHDEKIAKLRVKYAPQGIDIILRTERQGQSGVVTWYDIKLVTDY